MLKIKKRIRFGRAVSIPAGSAKRFSAVITLWVIAANRSGDCTIVLHDFNVTQVDTDKYVMFFTQVPANGVHVAGSGFACSNFVDDDGDGTVDYGHDDNCQSPTDDTE